MNTANVRHTIFRVGLFLACLCLAPAPALAALFDVNLDMSYFPSTMQPPDPTFQGSQLDGAASFFTQSLNDPPEPVTPIDIGNVAVGGTFLTSFLLDNTSRNDMTLYFSFSGLAGGFAAFGFDSLRSAGLAIPPDPTRYLIGTVPPGPSTFPPTSMSGVIVAYDAPVVVGTWDVTITAVPEPETYALLLAGLGLLGFMARRRQQHVA